MTAAHDTQALAAETFLEVPDVQDESGIDAYYSRTLVLQCIESALASRLQEQEGQPALSDELATAIHRMPYVRDCLLAYQGRPADPEAVDLVKAIAAQLGHLAAGSQAVQVPGWKLVPVEPTEEMLDEGAHQIYEPTNRNDLDRVWSAMLNAAPLQPLAGGEVQG